MPNKATNVQNIRLELDFVEILRARKRWNIYVVIATEDPRDTENTLITTLPSIPIKLRKMDKAAAVLTEAVDVIPDEATTVLQALLISLAEVYVDNGEFTKGWELTHAILQERWLDNNRSEAEALKVRGKILLCQHEYEKAQEFLLKSENMFRVLNLDYELISVFELLEECCNRLYDENQVDLYRKKREALAEKIGSD